MFLVRDGAIYSTEADNFTATAVACARARVYVRVRGAAGAQCAALDSISRLIFFARL